MKLKWYVPVFADYAGFIQGTHPTSHLMLIHLRWAREKCGCFFFQK